MSEPPAYRVPISPKAPMWLTPEEKSANITKELKIAARRFLCPNCGKEFSLFQSRAIACRACPKSTQNCKYVRCVHCDNEFPINGFVVNTKEKEKFLGHYMDGIVGNYHKSFGYYKR